MAQIDNYLTEEIYLAVNDTLTQASGLIDHMRANFDNISQDEKVFFLDIIQDLEEIIIYCENYKFRYQKFFKPKIKENVYRIIDGDTLVTIANKYYGDPTKWKDIYLANHLTDVDISSLSTLIIPEATDNG